jgi:predicted LPLAT superfamily acyltransferase
LSADRWAGIAEIGSVWALRFGARLHRIVGRRLSLLLIWPAVLYYYLRDGRARRASRLYLERVRAAQEARRVRQLAPAPPSALRHMHEFALSLYDRFLVWSGALDRMEVQHTGSGEIFDLLREGRGALLLGAHFGSIDMLWFLSRRHRLVVNVVVFFGNARRINSFLESLNPEAKVRVIDIDPGSVRAAFEIRACIQRGEIVVVLADRMAPGKTARAAEANFLGHPAQFPLAPFQLAGMLGCPVLLALCVRRGDARYETVMSPLAQPQRVPRGERDKRAREILEKYVALLESYCLEFPLQWFNFYDFWERDR